MNINHKQGPSACRTVSVAPLPIVAFKKEGIKQIAGTLQRVKGWGRGQRDLLLQV